MDRWVTHVGYPVVSVRRARDEPNAEANAPDEFIVDQVILIIFFFRCVKVFLFSRDQSIV